MASARDSGGGAWLRRHLPARPSPLGDAISAFPLFLVYQLGILLTGGGQNALDFATGALIELCERNSQHYLVVLAGMTGAYILLLVVLRRFGGVRPRAFAPLLIEAAVYAFGMGSLIVFVLRHLAGVLPGLAIGARRAAEVVVVSAGAGLNEELVFRVVLFGGTSWLLSRVMRPRRAWLVALVLSSLCFSLVHHIGPQAEPLQATAFVYRSLGGALLAVIYSLRGFSVAAWTHAFYDVYVLSAA
ncbi:MAG: CPBP family intramembrane glutamic endopeptidase [Myxococcota bacterium]